jgi:O-6-methylguanine DNA methyltransferase
VGIDTAWSEKIKSPAYKNMSREQLLSSIKLGQQILDGDADLVELDNRSLELRKKAPKGSVKMKGNLASLGKRKREEEKVSSRKMVIGEPPLDDDKRIPASDLNSDPTKPTSFKRQDDFTPYLKKIALSEKTSFQKRVLNALCQVPRGRYTTYGNLSTHLASSPRAVGNALRNNPFAPEVPCHRVLASGGGLGGFMGSWGRNGQKGLNDDKKMKLLREEGVMFDVKGRVVGSPWCVFQ